MGANTFLGTLSIAGGATARLGDGSSWAGALSGAGALVIDTTGNITLAAGNTGFTGSTTLSGTGTVTLAGADSLGSGRVTINNGVLDLASQNAANVILITKGSLANAGAKTAGNVEVAASAGTQGRLEHHQSGRLVRQPRQFHRHGGLLPAYRSFRSSGHDGQNGNAQAGQRQPDRGGATGQGVIDATA